MHTGPLGVLAWLIGSTLWELMNDGILVGTEAQMKPYINKIT